MITANENQWNEQDGQSGNHTSFSGANYTSGGTDKSYGGDKYNDGLYDPEDEEEADDNDELDEEDEDGIRASATDPDETPEEHESDNEGSGYHEETELEETPEGSDASFSEQTDVTPPDHKEFPSVGPAETDFVSRPHGRTTGRMVGHEPGTENNL